MLCAVGGTWILVDPPGFDINTYWRQPAQMVVGIMGVVFVWAWLCEVVTRRVPANRAFDVVYGWSGRVIAMYFAHWLIVTWSIGLIGFRSLSLQAVLVGMGVAVALTAYVSRPRPRLAALAWVHAPWAAWAHRRHLAERADTLRRRERLGRRDGRSDERNGLRRHRLRVVRLVRRQPAR